MINFLACPSSRLFHRPYLCAFDGWFRVRRLLDSPWGLRNEAMEREMFADRRIPCKLRVTTVKFRKGLCWCYILWQKYYN